MKEEAIQFGTGGRLLGIVTHPASPAAPSAPIVVLLNSGLLHRVGPGRLHVRLARQLAALGFTTFRIDLAGKGDSVKRDGLSNQESVAADYAEIITALETRFGKRKRLLAGICSGADNAVRLAIGDSEVTGVVLLDPIAFEDRGFRVRRLALKYTDRRRYVNRLRRIFLRDKPPARSDGPANALDLRDLPTQEQVRASVAAVHARGGRTLCVFTNYASGLEYYIQRGQFVRWLGGGDAVRRSVTELFWPDTEHTYKLDHHAKRLIETIARWLGRTGA
jgi:hypothetical protein